MNGQGGSPRKFREILSQHATLDHLVRRARALGDLQAQLDTRLGEGFARHCRVADLREDGTLVLVASSPAWASKLRYLDGALRKLAGEVPALAGFKSVTVQVARDQVG